MHLRKILLLFFLPCSAFAQTWNIITDFTILSDSSIFVLGTPSIKKNYKYLGGNYYAFDKKGRMLYDKYFEFEVYDYNIRDTLKKYEKYEQKSNYSYRFSRLFLVPLKERKAYIYGYEIGDRQDVHQIYIDQFGENKVDNHTYQTGFFVAKYNDDLFHKILRPAMCSSVDTIKLHKEYYLTNDSSFTIGEDKFVFSRKNWYSTLSCVKDKKIVWQQELDGEVPKYSEKSPFKIIEFNNELYFFEHNDTHTFSYLYRINKAGKIIWEISAKTLVVKKTEPNLIVVPDNPDKKKIKKNKTEVKPISFPDYLDKRVLELDGVITRKDIWDNINGDPRMLRKSFFKASPIDSTYEYFYIDGKFHFRKSWSKGKIHDEDVRYFADDGNTIYAEDDFNNGVLTQRKIYKGTKFDKDRPDEIFYFYPAGNLSAHYFYKNGYSLEKKELFKNDTCFRIIYPSSIENPDGIFELKRKGDSLYYSQASYTFTVKIYPVEGDTIKNADVYFTIDTLHKPIKAVYDKKTMSYTINIPAQKQFLYVKIEAKGYFLSETHKYIPSYSKALKQFAPLEVVLGKKKNPSYYAGNNYKYYSNKYDNLIGVLLKKTDSTYRKMFLGNLKRYYLEEDTSFIKAKNVGNKNFNRYNNRIGSYKNAGGVIVKLGNSKNIISIIKILSEDTLVLKTGRLLEVDPYKLLFLYDEAFITTFYHFERDDGNLLSLLSKYDFKLVKKNEYSERPPSFSYDDSGNLTEGSYTETESYIIQYTGEDIDDMDKQLEKLQHNVLILSASHQRNRVQQNIPYTDY